MHDYEGHRNCGIYVYGLVVWSAFYLKGEPPMHPNLENAKNTSKLFRDRWKWFPGSRQWLTHRIDQVFEDILKAKGERASSPWVKLYTRQENAAKAVKYFVNFHISPPLPPRQPVQQTYEVFNSHENKSHSNK